ncbi:MAG: alanine racemase [Thermoanaerobaculia bacterium]
MIPSHLIAEVSTGAVQHNLRHLRGLLPEGCRLWPVAKADAYGLGLEELWPTLAGGSDGLCVSNAREALELRDWGYEGGLLVLFPMGARARIGSAEDLARLVNLGVEMTVASLDEIEWLNSAAHRAHRIARVHLKVDTGMHRGGADLEEAAALADTVAGREDCELAGVYTHFATAEDVDTSFAEEQLERFLDWTRSVDSIPDSARRHAANSAALLSLGGSHLDLVRPGLSVYGYRPAEHLEAAAGLQPALRLVTHVMQTKKAAEGEGCGYGLTHRFDRTSRIGLVPIGYADGYLRALSNESVMRLRGTEVPCRGSVAMDQTILDLTDVADAEVGEEVEIISPDFGAGNSVERLARQAGTIPYEILTRLGARIERRLVS